MENTRDAISPFKISNVFGDSIVLTLSSVATGILEKDDLTS